MSYRHHPPPGTRRRTAAAPSPGKLARYRDARARAAYRVEPPPVEKLFAGPLTFRQFHDLWYAMIAPIPKTAAGQEIMSHLYSTLRDWLNTIEIVSDDYESERRMQEMKMAAINSGAVLGFNPDSSPRRRSVELDPPPRWTPGPFRRAS